jgi:hypothetical protein
VEGLRSGLMAKFSETELEKIPFHEEVEVSLSVTRAGLCNVFTDVVVQLTSTCERPSSNSFKYQYDVVTVEEKVQKIDYDKKVAPDTAFGKFSVTWMYTPPNPIDNGHSHRRAMENYPENDAKSLPSSGEEITMKILQLQIDGETRMRELLVEKDKMQSDRIDKMSELLAIRDHQLHVLQIERESRLQEATDQMRMLVYLGLAFIVILLAYISVVVTKAKTNKSDSSSSAEDYATGVGLFDNSKAAD